MNQIIENTSLKQKKKRIESDATILRKKKITELNCLIQEFNPSLRSSVLSADLKETLRMRVNGWKEEVKSLGGGPFGAQARINFRLNECLEKKEI